MGQILPQVSAQQAHCLGLPHLKGVAKSASQQRIWSTLFLLIYPTEFSFAQETNFFFTLKYPLTCQTFPPVIPENWNNILKTSG